MPDERRCCGSNACIVDAAGRCWCGQQWDGEKMCRVPLAPLTPEDKPVAESERDATRSPD